MSVKVRKLNWKRGSSTLPLHQAYCGETGPVAYVQLSEKGRWYSTCWFLGSGDDACGSHKTEALAKAKVQKRFDQLVQEACLA